MSIHIFSSSSSGRGVGYFFISLFGYPVKGIHYFGRVVKKEMNRVKNFFEMEKQMEILKRRLSDTLKENVRLKTELLKFREIEKMVKKYKNKNEFYEIPCNVIGEAREGAIMYIDCGKDAGIETGDGVVSAEGIVGKVSLVGKDFSTVITIQNSEFAVDCFTVTSRTRGVVKGHPSEYMVMIYISPDSSINERETVITMGFDRAFPAGLGLGKIKKIVTAKDGVTKKAIVEPFAKARSTFMVSVLKRKR